MNIKRGKRVAWISAAIAGVVLIAIGVAAALGAFNAKEADPYRQNSSQQSENNSDTSSDNQQQTGDNPSSTDDPNTPVSSGNTEPKSTVDPSTVSTIVIEPMSIEVAYVKGVGGFEFQVLRTPSGTQYVEFRNAELIGTKCTGDVGTFASIVESPSASEDTSTLSQKVTVDGTVYGLSLSGSNCTSDTTLLGKYQKSFSDAFSLLKKSSTN